MAAEAVSQGEYSDATHKLQITNYKYQADQMVVCCLLFGV
jgi:hypothetical protein